MTDCECCKKPVADGEKFVRLRHPDRTKRQMAIAHAKCAGPVDERVRTMAAKYREAIAEYTDAGL